MYLLLLLFFVIVGTAN